MTDLREYLRANLFDGDEGGTVKMKVSDLLDEVVEVVELCLREAEDRLNTRVPVTFLNHDIGTAVDLDVDADKVIGLVNQYTEAIRAENTRLRSQRWWDGENVQAIINERDRLRADLENCHADYMQADAECDRLQRSANGWMETARLAEQNKADREAERDRLRGLVQRWYQLWQNGDTVDDVMLAMDSEKALGGTNELEKQREDWDNQWP